MFRIKLVLVIGGGLLGFFGVQEMRVASSATSDPIDIDLGVVERGEVSDNTHWRLGEHVAVYGASVYQYRESDYSFGDPDSGAKVDHTYYPVLSYDHPFIQQLGELAEGDPVPPLNDFRVLVKTKEFGTIGAIPEGLDHGDSVQGLVVNLVTGLDAEEKDLFRESFPRLNVDELILIDAGRTPTPLAMSLGMVACGAVLAAGGGVLLAQGWNQRA